MNYFKPIGGPEAYVFNFTRVISGAGAEAVGECYSTSFSIYQYVMLRISQFTDFVNFLTAFLQNLIGNILNFNTIYQNIVNANNANKIGDVYFYIGRLSYLIVYFDPLVDEALIKPSPKFAMDVTPAINVYAMDFIRDKNMFL